MKHRLYHVEFRADGSVRRLSSAPATSGAVTFWRLPDGRCGGGVLAKSEADAVAKLRAEKERRA